MAENTLHKNSHSKFVFIDISCDNGLFRNKRILNIIDRFDVNNRIFVRRLFCLAGAFLVMLSVLILMPKDVDAATGASEGEDKTKVGPVRTDISAINAYNRVHRRSNIWINITNWGYFGNDGENRSAADDDPCRPGEWAPQCEYPGGSNVQYLYMGALWLGALIRAEGYEYPRVSVGSDGWIPDLNEFWPGEGATHSLENGIVERTTLPIDYDCLGNYIGGFRDSAVSEQDFVCSYADTLTESFYVNDNPIDGPHAPLGIKITQKSYAWTYNYAQNFIIIDWEIENIAGNYLKNLYVGLYIDADVGRRGQTRRHQDDICGFQRWYYYERPDGQIDSSVINTAWIADNDGRPIEVASGTDFSCPAITGVRVVRAPNPKLRTSFNWWVSHGNQDLDFGPSWKDDGAPGGWTDVNGTPMGDVKKYFILSNREFDYDQVYVDKPDYIREHNQVFRDRWDPSIILEEHEWKIPGEDDGTPPDLTSDLANGYDTRYLLSWGPLGIFDHIDEAGNRIYRLNPGEKFSMTIAYVAGDNFHNRNNPQSTDETIDPSRFNFNSLRYNADWAARVYDNPMIDTPIHDWGNDHIAGTNDLDGSEGDGILDTGDGWFGEDVGEDGLYAAAIGDIAYIWEGGIRKERIYPGPDEGENDGHLSLSEDGLERPENLEYTRLNGMLDFGDGYPDFKGPPPPPAPALTNVKQPTTIALEDRTVVFDQDFLSNNVILKWNQYPSEDSLYMDPFSREWDFEGYRIYVSNTAVEKEFSFMDEFDRIDYALYSAKDSLASRPVSTPDSLPADTIMLGVDLYRKEVGRNVGFEGHENLIFDKSTGDYYYIVNNAHPMIPKYYAVTAYDYGDYKTGTQPLESAKIANATYIAPSGTDKKTVQIVPNPYRANANYRKKHGGVSWENRDDGTLDFYPQTDRRMFFYNLPKKCLIRIYTVAGDLVIIIPHNVEGDRNLDWNADFAESWDLNSRNKQQVVSGMYMFTVEDMTEENKGDIQTGKFVVIR